MARPQRAQSASNKKEKRILFTVDEDLADHATLAKMSAAAGRQINFSTLGRALFGIVRANEEAVLGALGVASLPPRPANGDAAAALVFERELGRAIERAIRRSSRYRDNGGQEAS